MVQWNEHTKILRERLLFGEQMKSVLIVLLDYTLYTIRRLIGVNLGSGPLLLWMERLQEAIIFFHTLRILCHGLLFMRRN